MKLPLLLLAGLLPLLALRAQTENFPQPPAELKVTDGEKPERVKLEKLQETYGALWQTGKARWMKLEPRFTRAAKCYTATVEKMEYEATSSKWQVVFRAWFESDLDAMRSDTFAIGRRKPLSTEPLPPAPVIPGGREYRLTWDRAGCPPPFAPGTRVELGVDAAGKVICANMTAYDITAVRLTAEDRLEVILQLEKVSGELPPEPGYLLTEPSKKLLYLKPDLTNLQLDGDNVRLVNVLWEDGGTIALVALGEEAGDDMSESVIKLQERRGVPVENDPQFRFVPGEDGWRRYRSLPRNAGALGYEYLIPATQFATLRDGFDGMPLESLVNETNSPLTGGSVWFFPDSGERLLGREELSRLTEQELWRAKNEIYARHGYIFTTERGRIYAASLGDAYSPRIKGDAAVTATFNEIEKKNVALIAGMMK